MIFFDLPSSFLSSIVIRAWFGSRHLARTACPGAFNHDCVHPFFLSYGVSLWRTSSLAYSHWRNIVGAKYGGIDGWMSSYRYLSSTSWAISLRWVWVNKVLRSYMNEWTNDAWAPACLYVMETAALIVARAAYFITLGCRCRCILAPSIPTCFIYILRSAFNPIPHLIYFFLFLSLTRCD